MVLSSLNGAFLFGRVSMARKWSAIAAYNVVFLLLLSFRGTVANADEDVPETTSESGIKGAGHGFEGGIMTSPTRRWSSSLMSI